MYASAYIVLHTYLPGSLLACGFRGCRRTRPRRRRDDWAKIPSPSPALTLWPPARTYAATCTRTPRVYAYGLCACFRRKFTCIHRVDRATALYAMGCRVSKTPFFTTRVRFAHRGDVGVSSHWIDVTRCLSVSSDEKFKKKNDIVRRINDAYCSTTTSIYSHLYYYSCFNPLFSSVRWHNTFFWLVVRIIILSQWLSRFIISITVRH